VDLKMTTELKDKPLINLRELEQKIESLLQNNFSDENTKLPKNLQPTIHEQIIHAYLYGFKTEQQFTNYVVTAWQFGREFDLEFPGVKEIMESSNLEPDEKSKWLTQWTNNMIFASQGVK
jgi:hypothetical protein